MPLPSPPCQKPWSFARLGFTLPVLALAGYTPGRQADLRLAHGVTLTVFDMETAAALAGGCGDSAPIP
jgi:hypothetical protein